MLVNKLLFGFFAFSPTVKYHIGWQDLEVTGIFDQLSEVVKVPS